MQYRRRAYAINSMKYIELHDAAHVKIIVDKGGRCNATQSNVTRMASLSQTRVNSNYVLNFHSDTTWKQIWLTHCFCVFLVYKIKAYAKIKHWGRNYLISNWRGGKETKYRGICFLPDKKTLRIHREGITDSDDSFDFRAWRKTNPREENKFLVIWSEWVRKPKSSYSTLWVNVSYVTNFYSNASFGSDQRLTLGNIIDGDVPFLGTIAAMEIYVGITEGVPGHVLTLALPYCLGSSNYPIRFVFQYPVGRCRIVPGGG